MKKVIIKAVVKLAEKTAMYSTTKASGWYHYQPREPKSLNQYVNRKNAKKNNTSGMDSNSSSIAWLYGECFSSESGNYR